MRALDVVGVDFELRLGVGLSGVAQQQVRIALLGVRLLGGFGHVDASREHAVRLILQDAAVELSAVAMRLLMLDAHVVVHVLLTPPNVKPIDQTDRALTVHHRMYVVAHELAAQQNRVRIESAVAPLPAVQRRDVVRRRTLSLDQIVADVRSGPGDHLRDRVGQVHIIG